MARGDTVMQKKIRRRLENAELNFWFGSKFFIKILLENLLCEESIYFSNRTVIFIYLLFKLVLD